MKIAEQVRQFAEPIVQAQGCSLWDVEYVREGGEWFLRVYLDREGGADINDCEAVSRALDPILDEKDPIPESYHFEVCSAGLERALRRPEHFAWATGRQIVVRLYRPLESVKEFTGVLTGYDGGRICLDTAAGPRSFGPDEVALARLYLEF